MEKDLLSELEESGRIPGILERSGKRRLFNSDDSRLKRAVYLALLDAVKALKKADRGVALTKHTRNYREYLAGVADAESTANILRTLETMEQRKRDAEDGVAAWLRIAAGYGMARLPSAPPDVK